MAGKKSRTGKRGSSSSKSDEGGRQVIATNRKAWHNYVILSKIEAGLSLVGSEVKSLRVNGATIREGYAKMDDGELWLLGVHIAPLSQASYLNHEPLRPRKCLVHRKELRRIEESLEAKGLTMVPLSLYFKGVRVKVELGMARGRQKGDRRSREREKEDRREMRDRMHR